MFVWVVLLLISMLQRVLWGGRSADSSRQLPITECWPC